MNSDAAVLPSQPRERWKSFVLYFNIFYKYKQDMTNNKWITSEMRPEWGEGKGFYLCLPYAPPLGDPLPSIYLFFGLFS